MLASSVRIVSVCLACWLSLITHAQAQAQAQAQESGSYAALIRDAVTEYEAGHYEEAAALFAQAHAQSPSARTHRGLGLAYFEGRKYALAVKHLKAALGDRRRALTASQREEVDNALHHAEQFVVSVKLQLEPRDARVEIDGNLAPADERGARHDGALELQLDAGRHELVTRADGYVEDRRSIDAVAGSQLALEITLTSVAGGAQAQTRSSTPLPDAHSAPAPRSDASTGPSLVGPLIVLGGGAALLLGALGTGIAAQSAHSDLEKRCPNGQCPASLEGERDRGETLVTVTNLLLVAGAVAAAAGVGWLILQPGERERVSVGAACMTHGCAVALRGAL
jgi:hypothetical protein